MKQVLFPFDKDKYNESNPGNHPSAFNRRPSSSVSKREPLNPLEMAEKIAQMVGSQPDCRNGVSSQFNTTFLGKESPIILSNPGENGISRVPSATAMKIDNDYVFVAAPESTARTKRSVDGKKISQGRNDPIVVPVVKKAVLMPWDPSFLLIHNPNDTTAKMAVKELTSLAERLESMPNYSACHSSYKRFRTALFEETYHLFKENSSDLEKKNLCFGYTYSDAIQHMKALIAMAEKINEEGTNNVKMENEEKANLAGIKTCNGNDVSIADEVELPFLRRIYDKKAFSQYMNQWLVKNWTNPYPDDEGLERLADMNGTTVTVVSNWLINARTRKWRPAIVKAYEAGRPADMLQEDSIKMFQGAPLRKLRGKSSNRKK